MQHPWPSTDHYRRTLENRSPTSFESRTLMNIRFRRQHGPMIPVSNTNTFTSEIKQSQADTKPQKTKYAQTRHKNLINLGEDTRTPTINTPRQQYERQPTHNRVTTPKQEDLLRRNSREQIHQKLFYYQYVWGHESVLGENAKKRPGDHKNENENKRPHLERTTAPDATHRTNPRWRRKKVEKNANPGGGILHQWHGVL